MMLIYMTFLFFFFNDTATTEIYTLSLHDALPILNNTGPDSMPASPSLLRMERSSATRSGPSAKSGRWRITPLDQKWRRRDRKSTRLNSSHSQISYAVFCLKKKKKTNKNIDSNVQN